MHDLRRVEKGSKRKAADEPTASSHHDKKKKVSNSKSTPTIQKKNNVFNHIIKQPHNIAKRLCKQAMGKKVVPLRFVFVLCESEIIRSAELLNHLPHLIGEVNARSEHKAVKLVRLPKGARQSLNEIWKFGSFDLEVSMHLQSRYV